MVRYYGMNGLKQLVQASGEREAVARQHHARVVMAKCVTEWRAGVALETKWRRRKADAFNEKRLKRVYFAAMKRSKSLMQIAAAKAARFHRYRAKARFFDAWRVYTRVERVKYGEYEVLVREHNVTRLQACYFRLWRAYPAEARRERARQKRIDELKSKVRAIIPDYDVAASASNADISVEARNNVDSVLALKKYF